MIFAHLQSIVILFPTHIPTYYKITRVTISHPPLSGLPKLKKVPDKHRQGVEKWCATLPFSPPCRLVRLAPDTSLGYAQTLPLCGTNVIRETLFRGIRSIATPILEINIRWTVMENPQNGFLTLPTVSTTATILPSYMVGSCCASPDIFFPVR